MSKYRIRNEWLWGNRYGFGYWPLFTITFWQHKPCQLSFWFNRDRYFLGFTFGSKTIPFIRWGKLETL